MNVFVQTPSIVEATGRSRSAADLQPESPLPEITREGPLWCKTAMSDGKVHYILIIIFRMLITTNFSFYQSFFALSI